MIGPHVPPKAIFLFVGATLLGLVAVIIARVFLVQPASASPAAVAAPAALNVVVARTVIPAGATLVAAQLKQVAMSGAALPVGVYSTIADAVGKDNRIALRQIDTNEIVLAKAVSDGGNRLGTSGVIVPRMRAVAVRVTDVAGVGGLLSPGDRVDVLVTRTIPGVLGGPAATEVQTDVIVQSARVLAVDQETSPVHQQADKTKVPATVTVEVEVGQAQRLALAQTVGTISLMLRASNDLGTAASRTVRLADLRTGGALAAARPRRPVSSVHPAAAPPAPATINDVEVVRGMDAKRYALPVMR